MSSFFGSNSKVLPSGRINRSGNRYRKSADRGPVRSGPSLAERLSRLGHQGDRVLGQARELGHGVRAAAQARSAGRSFSLPRLNPCLLQWGVHFLIWPLFIAAATWGCLGLYRYVTAHDYFSLREIEVSGNRRLSSADVMDAAGVRLGMQTLELSMDDLRAGLLSNPWVEGAVVKRELPATIRLSVVEREPKYWVQQEKGLFYADEHGHIIAPVESRGFVSLPVVRLEDADSSLLAVLGRLRALAEAKKLPFSLQDVGWIKLSHGGGVECKVESANLIVAMNAEGFAEHAARLNTVWADLHARGELPQVSAIRLAGEKVWVERRGVEPRKANGQAAPPQPAPAQPAAPVKPKKSPKAGA